MRHLLDDDWTYDGEVEDLMALGCSWANATSIAGNKMIAREYSLWDEIRAEPARAAPAAPAPRKHWLSRILTPLTH